MSLWNLYLHVIARRDNPMDNLLHEFAHRDHKKDQTHRNKDRERNPTGARCG